MSAAAADVFLSYSRTDAPAVRQIQAYLKQAGLATFLDRDQLPAGQPWLSALEQAIARCAAVAVLVGPAGLGTWQQREVQLALDRQAAAERSGRPFPVIPILLPKVEDPPGGFLRLQTWVDLRSDLADPAQLHLLLTGLRGQAPADASAVPEALCPYRGLLPFREEDAALFFGREEAIDTLVGKLRNHNLVTLVGRSGSGKSSVVSAGLIPALRRRADGRTWSIRSLRPGAEPLHALVRLFDPPPLDLPPFEADQRVEQQVMILRTDDHALGRRIRSLLATAEETGTDRLLLYVDQWEELWTQAQRNLAIEPEQAERDVSQFINLMLEATRTSPCTVVLTVRADFYGEFLKHGSLAASVPPGQVNLGPLSREGLAAAIRKPAEALGLTVDPPLLETLVDEVCYDLGKLPLLEYALKETWRRREGQRLTLNAYGEAGGIDGAVAQRANQIFTSLSQAQQAAARRLFVSLVTPGEGREDTRASAVYPEQDDAIAAVINKFSAADARLLVTGEDAPSARRLVELSHEAMIREWDLLKNWIESNREALRRREHIRARLRQWEEQGRDSTLLLPPGLPLEEGRKLLADHGDVLIDEVQPYISASITANRAREEATRAAMMPIRTARALAFGLGLGIIFSVLALTPIGAALEEAVSLPWLFRMRGAIEPPSDVIIVAIDQQSADYLGLPPQPREWPRSHHARLIGELKKRGATAVIFDLKFERPQSPAEDDEFASAMRDFGRVFLVKGRDREVNPIIGNIGSPTVDVPLQNELEEAALGVAPFPLPRVESRQVNQVWALHADDATLPAVALHAGVEDRWLELLSTSGFPIGAAALDAKKVSVSS